MRLILVVFFVMFGICNGGVEYRVGDAPGWTINGNVDYYQWASSKPFHVQDTLLFEYDPQNHNVVQVNRSSFHACDTSAPIATYTSGHDSIVIRGPGHYYYICGFAGHCQAGQKVDIRVLKVPIKPASIPISSPIQLHNESTVPLAPISGPIAPGPFSSDGQNLSGLFSFSLGLLIIIIVWAFI